MVLYKPNKLLKTEAEKETLMLQSWNTRPKGKRIRNFYNEVS